MSKINKILWFTWKDRQNPLSGGAEVVNEEVAKRLVQQGYQVTFIVANFPGSQSEEIIDGYKIIRVGGKWSVYWQAYRYYKKNLVGWADLVIDEINTIPFFCKFYVKERNIILSYQLCRQIWFYQMFFPLNLIGYLLEPVYLRLLNDRYVLTESESSKIDFQKYGFPADKIFVFPVGLEQAPISESEFNSQVKEINPTILYLGALRKMKRPDQVFKAFILAKKEIPQLRLWLAGSGAGRYAQRILKQIARSPFKQDITYYGQVSPARKLELMDQAHLIIVTSMQEGWGIIITEANSRGTPAVTYNVDGLRDSCKDKITGLICQENTPEQLANNIISLFKNQELYQQYRYQAWQDSQNYNYQRSAEIFLSIINKLNI